MMLAETTQSAIFAAAEKLFVQKNYADVSMRDIAKLARVSTGALYHYFPSKEKLYCAMLTRYMKRIQDTTLDAIPSEGTCRERLCALTHAFLAMRRAQSDVMRLVRRDINVFKGRTRKRIIHAYQAAVPTPVEQVLKDAIERNEIKKCDTRWMAWVYVAIVETTLPEYAQEKLGGVDARLDAALDLFLQGAREAGT